MNRIGYAIVAVLALACLAYAFWPGAIKDEAVPLRQGPQPAAFTVRMPGLEQRVDVQAVRFAGLERPVDFARVSALWSAIDAITAPKDKVSAGVAEGDLAAYGIDGARAIDSEGWRLRWGRSAGLGYLWDGRRVLCVPSAVCDRLDAAATRLDDRALLPGTVDRIAVGELRLERAANGGWIDRARPDRPSLSVRSARLQALIANLKLESLEPAPAATAPAALSFSLAMTAAGLAAESVPTPPVEHQLKLYADGDAAIAVVDALPPQRVGPALFAAWKRAADDLSRDVLIDADPGTMRAEVVRFAVELGGQPWFAVERRGQGAYRPGETTWDLSWEGGRETASEDQLAAALGQLCDVAVERAAPGPDPSPPSPLARRFRCAYENGGQAELTIDGDRAWTPTHHGRLARPTPLAVALQPAALLDLALVAAPPERVSKVQVQVLDAEPRRAEVLARAEDGAWSRTYPARGPVDAVAVGRIAKAFCAARAASARLLIDEDRAALDHPACEVCLRLAAKSAGAPSMEIADERDTVPQDRAFAFYRDRAGAWRAIDIEGGVSYAVDEDLVELARHPLDSDLAFPLVPGLVRRIEIARGTAPYALVRGGDGGWSVETADGPAKATATDALEVRRLLRALGDLRAAARAPKAEPLLPAKAAAVVTCLMPGANGDERLTLALAEPRGGSAEASVDSTSASTLVPPGRVTIPLGALDEVAPPLSRFAAAAPPAPAQ